MGIAKILILGAVAVSMYGHAWAAALPVESQSLVSQSAAADSILKYSIEYFLQAVLQAPADSKCLFYTSALGVQAQTYATANDYSTIWTVWAAPGSTPGGPRCDLYNDSTDANNPLREIMADDTQRIAYFSNMAKAYARLCSGTALLMTGQNPVSASGIWEMVEYPALTATGNQGGEVDVITAIDPSGDEVSEVWERPVGSKKRGFLSLGEEVSRDLTPSTCLTAQQIQNKFGDIDW